MKAMIMAGGEGQRLRPMTCDCPKPMMRLLGAPILHYALKLLERHGVTEAGVTLAYLPERVTEAFGDAYAGVNLRYWVEDKPLGTAGSVRRAADFLTETFAVLSGDGLTDCDLTRALQIHRARGALATMVLKRVENPLEYGVVMTGENDRVTRFLEKPGWGEVFSDTVNTGIYILEPEALALIPEDRPYDFGRELFPTMVARGLPVCAYVSGDYWCDVGDVGAFLRATGDLMDGRTKFELPMRPGGVCRMPGAIVDRGSVLEGPCYIGAGARVEEGARVGAYSVVGEGCVVGAYASLKRCVMMPYSRAMERAQLRGCVLMEGACAGREGALFEESVLGEGASLGSGACLMPGAKIWPRKRVADGLRVDENLVWGGAEKLCFRAGQLPLSSPARTARIAEAYCAQSGARTMLVMRSHSAEAQAQALAAQSGCMAQGAQVLDAGAGTLAQLRDALWSLGAEAALYVEAVGMLPLDAQGALLGTKERRKLEGLLLRQDYERPFLAPTPAPVAVGRTDLAYVGRLAASVSPFPAEARVALHAKEPALLALAERAFERARCAVRAEWEEELMELAPNELGIWLDGDSARFADECGALSEPENQLLLAWTALEAGAKRLVASVGDTRALEALAACYGATVERVRSEAASFMRALLDADKAQFRLRFDAVYAALHVSRALCAASLSLKDWRECAPRVNRRARRVPIDWADRGRVLRALAEQEPDADLTDGVAVTRGEDWAWVDAASDEPVLSVVGEARTMEAASELCDFYVEKLKALLAAKNQE